LRLQTRTSAAPAVSASCHRRPDRPPGRIQDPAPWPSGNPPSPYRSDSCMMQPYETAL
jgi:hypothetical protein